MYATRFYDSIKDDKDFIEAIKSKNFHPVMRKDGEFKTLDYSYEYLLSLKKGTNVIQKQSLIKNS